MELVKEKEKRKVAISRKERNEEHFNKSGLGSNQGTYNAFEDVNFFDQVDKINQACNEGVLERESKLKVSTQGYVTWDILKIGFLNTLVLHKIAEQYHKNELGIIRDENVSPSY